MPPSSSMVKRKLFSPGLVVPVWSLAAASGTPVPLTKAGSCRSWTPCYGSSLDKMTRGKCFAKLLSSAGLGPDCRARRQGSINSIGQRACQSVPSTFSWSYIRHPLPRRGSFDLSFLFSSPFLHFALLFISSAPVVEQFHRQTSLHQKSFSNDDNHRFQPPCSTR